MTLIQRHRYFLHRFNTSWSMHKFNTGFPKWKQQQSYCGTFRLTNHITVPYKCNGQYEYNGITETSENMSNYSVSTVPADGPAPLGARTFAGIVITVKFGSVIPLYLAKPNDKADPSRTHHPRIYDMRGHMGSSLCAVKQHWPLLPTYISYCLGLGHETRLCSLSAYITILLLDLLATCVVPSESWLSTSRDMMIRSAAGIWCAYRPVGYSIVPYQARPNVNNGYYNKSAKGSIHRQNPYWTYCSIARPPRETTAILSSTLELGWAPLLWHGWLLADQFYFSWYWS